MSLTMEGCRSFPNTSPMTLFNFCSNCTQNAPNDVHVHTRQDLSPDFPAGSYCYKIQWFQRTSRDDRFFTLTSTQCTSLSYIVTAPFKIVLEQRSRSRCEINDDLQRKMLTRIMGGLMIDD